MSCECEITREGPELRLVANCRSCREGKGDLSEPACFGGILRAFSQGLGADAIVLSRPVEVQYGGDAIELFRLAVGILELMDSLGLRDPVARYGKGDSAMARVCSKCTLNPNRLFGGLAEDLHKGPGYFFDVFKERLGSVTAGRTGTRACPECLADSREDMALLFKRFEDFVRHVVKQGFSIVV